MEWLFRLSESSRVLQLVGEAWRLIQAGAARPSSISVVHAGDGGPEQGDADRALQEAGLDAMIYRPPSDPSWTEAWAITERLLLAMQDEVNAHGAKFLLVTLTNGPQVDPRPGVRLAVQQQVGMPDLLYPDDRIRIFSARHGIPVLTLVPFFQAYAEARGVFLHGFANSGLGRGHWNGTGHRLAGELLAREVCGQIFSRHAGPDHPQSTLGPRDSRS
jgi:hypothetical protein